MVKISLHPIRAYEFYTLDARVPDELKRIQENKEIYSIHTDDPKLEDVFINLVRGEK